MSSVGGLAVAVAAVAVAAVGKAATRYHRGGGDQDMHPKYPTRGETERMHWPLGLQVKGKEVGATVAVKVNRAYSL
jgi:hypothetical protein